MAGRHDRLVRNQQGAQERGDETGHYRTEVVDRYHRDQLDRYSRFLTGGTQERRETAALHSPGDLALTIRAAGDGGWARAKWFPHTRELGADGVARGRTGWWRALPAAEGR